VGGCKLINYWNILHNNMERKADEFAIVFALESDADTSAML
jgi:hypothetical protein